MLPRIRYWEFLLVRGRGPYVTSPAQYLVQQFLLLCTCRVQAVQKLLAVDYYRTAFCFQRKFAKYQAGWWLGWSACPYVFRLGSPIFSPSQFMICTQKKGFKAYQGDLPGAPDHPRRPCHIYLCESVALGTTVIKKSWLAFYFPPNASFTWYQLSHYISMRNSVIHI